MSIWSSSLTGQSPERDILSKDRATDVARDIRSDSRGLTGASHMQSDVVTASSCTALHGTVVAG